MSEMQAVGSSVRRAEGSARRQCQPGTTMLKISAWNVPGPAGGSLVNQIST